MRFVIQSEIGVESFNGYPEELSEILFQINFRECIEGERLTEAGVCQYCQAPNFYSIEKQAEPGQCRACQHEVSMCNGGAKVYPKFGYWRFSNTSDTFERCLYSPACM